MGEYLATDERLRRIGDLLLKGVYLWAEATERDAAAVRQDMEKPTNGAIVRGEARRPGRATHAIQHPNDARGRHGPDKRERRPTPVDGSASARDRAGDGGRAAATMAHTRVRCPLGSGPLEDFAIQFDDVFRTPAQRRGFRTYLQGLLSRRERRRSLATLAGADSATGASAAPMQRLQYFLCESAWDAGRLAARRLELLVAARAAAPHRSGALVIDDALGREAGSAATPPTLTSLWADEQVHYPLHIQPYSPAEYIAEGTTDPSLRGRPDALVALVEGVRAMGSIFRAVVAKCPQSECARLEEALQAARVPYVLALQPSDDCSAARSDAAHALAPTDRMFRRGRLAAPSDWSPIVRRLGDGRDETWWAAERCAQTDERAHAGRAVVATTDPIVLPAAHTWYLVTNLPRPGSPPSGDAPIPPADRFEAVRLYGLHQSVTQRYRQVRQELGCDHIMVRSPRAMRRHWELACCALLFYWQVWFAGEAVDSRETALAGPLDIPV
jgi:hypothetical protein